MNVKEKANQESKREAECYVDIFIDFSEKKCFFNKKKEMIYLFTRKALAEAIENLLELFEKEKGV